MSTVGEKFTVAYEDDSGRIEVVVEREPFGWVMHHDGMGTLLGMRAPADLVLRSLLQLEESVTEALKYPHSRRRHQAGGGA